MAKGSSEKMGYSGFSSRQPSVAMESTVKKLAYMMRTSLAVCVCDQVIDERQLAQRQVFPPQFNAR
jgi:hypothetical protein